MDITEISTDLSVASQVLPEDLPSLAQKGFRSLICNRPDGEAPDQPSFDRVAAAARAIGLEARYLPIVPGQMEEADAIAFADALWALPAPVLAYCRTGNRSSMLWTMVSAKADQAGPSS